MYATGIAGDPAWTPGQLKGREENIGSLMRKADAQKRNGNIGKAEDIYRKVIKRVNERIIDSDISEGEETRLDKWMRVPYYKLGNLLENRGKAKEALGCYEEARLKDHPEAETAVYRIKDQIKIIEQVQQDTLSMYDGLDASVSQVGGMSVTPTMLSQMSEGTLSKLVGEMKIKSQGGAAEIAKEKAELEEARAIAELKAKAAREQEEREEQELSISSAQQMELERQREEIAKQKEEMAAKEAPLRQEKEEKEKLQKQLKEQKAASDAEIAALKKQQQQKTKAKEAEVVSKAGSKLKAPAPPPLQSTSSVVPASGGKGVREILNEIGEVHKIRREGEKETIVTVLREDKLKKIIDMGKVFSKCARKKYSERDGLIVDVDLYQQQAILESIIDRYPEMREKIGFTNLRGSRKVYEVLNKAGVHKRLPNEWGWFWTGEKYLGHRDESKYPSEGIITATRFNISSVDRFCIRRVYYDDWSDDDPDFCNGYFGVVVLEGLI